MLGICVGLGDTILTPVHRKWYQDYAEAYELPVTEQRQGWGICVGLGDSGPQQDEHRENLEGYADLFGLTHDEIQDCC